MAEELFDALGELGIRMGMHLMGKAIEPGREVDMPKLVNCIIHVAGQTAGNIIERLKLGETIDRDKFFEIGCIIAEEYKSLAELCLDIQVDVEAATISMIENWEAALQQVKGKASHG